MGGINKEPMNCAMKSEAIVILPLIRLGKIPLEMVSEFEIQSASSSKKNGNASTVFDELEPQWSIVTII